MTSTNEDIVVGSIWKHKYSSRERVTDPQGNPDFTVTGVSDKIVYFTASQTSYNHNYRISQYLSDLVRVPNPPVYKSKVQLSSLLQFLKATDFNIEEIGEILIEMDI